MGRIGSFIRKHNGNDRTMREIAKAEKRINARIDKLEKRVNSHTDRFEKRISKQVRVQSKTIQTIAFGQYAMDNMYESFNEAKLNWFRALPHAEGEARDIQIAVEVLLRKLDQICRSNDIDYWIDFGTLLGAVRHGGYIPWDDDIDVSMMRKDAERFIEVTKDDPDFRTGELYFHSATRSANHNVQFRYREKPGQSMPYCLDIFIYDYCDDSSEGGVTWRRLKELKESHRKAAWDLYEDMVNESCSEFSPEFQNAAKELFNERSSAAFSELGLSLTPKKEMIWGFDNRVGATHSFTKNGPVDEVFPLIELEFEGHSYKAPRCYVKRLETQYGDFLALPGDLGEHVHFKLGPVERESLDYVLKHYAS